MEIMPGELRVRAIDDQRQVIDSFTILKGVPRPVLEFLRGDVDFSGILTITDPIRLLNFLFASVPIDCPAVADVEASGQDLTITEAIYVLNFLFLGGPPPEPPFPECGPAPETDDAFCKRSGCEA